MDFTQIRQFNFPTVIRFGVGAVKELAPYVASQGFSKPLIVTDPVIAELGFFKQILADLTKAGFSVEVFSSIHMLERRFGMLQDAIASLVLGVVRLWMWRGRLFCRLITGRICSNTMI
jgi:alcohol dehydrogenase class IV